jgi:hypothetical protein
VVISKVRRPYKIYSSSWPSSSDLRGRKRTYLTILKRAWSANLKLLRWINCNWTTYFVCLFVTMRPAVTRCICELYWHNITSFNNNSIHTIHAPVRFEPASTRDPTATHHLSLPGLRNKTLLTTCQTSSPVEVWHVRVPAYVVK